MIIKSAEFIKSSSSIELCPETTAPEFAFIGRSNVGKSSLVNKILGENRVIVNSKPGTTIDAIDSVFVKNNKTYTIIDTAGIRKKSKMSSSLEYISALSAIKSITRCDIAILMLTAEEGPVDLDNKIANIIINEGKSCIIAVNKSDLIDLKLKTEYTKLILNKLHQIDFAPIFFISAKTGQNIDNIFPKINKSIQEKDKQINQNELYKYIKELFLRAPGSPKFLGIKQLKIMYPIFVIYTKKPEEINLAFEKFLINGIRKKYGFMGNPIKIIFRKHK
jgi:GTP-binding protein